VNCAIKWPNDVWIDHRKVAGILVEGRPQQGWAVLGIGLNVATAEDEFPAELRATATSLAIAARMKTDLPDIEAVLAGLLDALGQWLYRPEPDVLHAWRGRDALRGGRVRWDGGEGVAAGIDDTGSLLVETSAGRRALDAGEVHLLG
jgi:BirA family biotin operon repressor/biotin-[acetyl-CoA-carboxylase] ligase